MFKLTIECATQAELAALVAHLGGEVTTKPGKSQATTTPKPSPEPSTATEPVSASTPDQAKGSDVDALLAAPPADLTADQLRAVDAGSLAKEQFSKLGMKFAKRLNDNGAKAKEIWAKYKQADGSAIAGFGSTQPGDYAAMIGEWADALAEAEMS